MTKPLAALLLVALIAATATADPLAPEAVLTPSPEDGALPVAGGPVTADAPGARLVVGVDYILWWLREGRLPPTLTTSSQASRGLLGQSDTRLLYGGDRIPTRHGDRFNGVRPEIEYWFDDARTLGVEARAFFLERDSTSTRTPTAARPAQSSPATRRPARGTEASSATRGSSCSARRPTSSPRSGPATASASRRSAARASCKCATGPT